MPDTPPPDSDHRGMNPEPSDLSGKRITVMGLGRFGGGVGVTRFLVEQGAEVLVTDRDPEAKLAASIAQLADLPEGSVTYRLGGHHVSDFTTCDWVVANPAVPPGNRFLRAAEAAGVPITTEIRLLVERLPNRLKTIGVTGSAGKSTVTAMIGHVLNKLLDKPSYEIPDARETGCKEPRFRLGGFWLGRAKDDPAAVDQPRAEKPKVWIGGNLGGSLLPKLSEIGPEDWVVLELSSFMLHHLREHDGMAGWSPHIAVVTNLKPNHLDWHGTFESYHEAKQVIFDYQVDADKDAAYGGPGTHDVFQEYVSEFDLASEAYELLVSPPFELIIPGEHNQLNARLACNACEYALGLEPGESFEWISGFPGLPHRLQFVAEHHGVRFFNDSKSTTPEAAMLAIDAFDAGGTHIILGGSDKGSDLSELAAHAAKYCAGVYTIGATGETIAASADACSGSGLDKSVVHRCGELGEAVRQAVRHAKPGEVVLLSPGCASWDQFDHFEQRGQHFVEQVKRWTELTEG